MVGQLRVLFDKGIDLDPVPLADIADCALRRDNA